MFKTSNKSLPKRSDQELSVLNTIRSKIIAAKRTHRMFPTLGKIRRETMGYDWKEIAQQINKKGHSSTRKAAITLGWYENGHYTDQAPDLFKNAMNRHALGKYLHYLRCHKYDDYRYIVKQLSTDNKPLNTAKISDLATLIITDNRIRKMHHRKDGTLRLPPYVKTPDFLTTYDNGKQDTINLSN